MVRPDTFVSVDIETTGLNSDLHEIIEIGAVKVVQGKVTAEFSELVKPEKPVPEFITRLTGISERDLRNAGSIRQTLPAFLDFVAGYTILGQNVGFDVSFLRTAAGLGNFSAPVDNCELARILLPMLPSFSLDSLIDFFALKPPVRHRALADAQVTAEVFLKLLDMLRLVPDSLLTEMVRISARAGSSLHEVFEAHLLERANEPLHLRAKARTTGPVTGKTDNIYGNFSGEPDTREVEGAQVSEQQVESLLKADGGLSRQYEAFEERAGQVALARHITAAFNRSEILLAEAGTGIGKSIAYLLPSILFSEAAQERVIVSTNTKNLQEQLFFKDIPLLGKVMDFPFRAAILKGRGNYLCLHRWERLVEAPDQYMSKQERSLILPVAAWLHATSTGDLSETGFFSMLAEMGLLDRINSDSISCLGARCPHRDACFVNRIRRAALRSHIVIVNHSLVFSDMVSEGAVLGGYSRIIFDEAHNLEKVALRFLGISFTYYRIRRILNHLYTRTDGAYGILAGLDSWVRVAVKAWPEYLPHISLFQKAIDTVQTVRTVTQELFSSLQNSVSQAASGEGDSHDGKHRYYPESPVFLENEDSIGEFREAFDALLKVMEEIFTLVSTLTSNRLSQRDDLLIDIEKSRVDLRAVIADLDFLIEAAGKNVFWFEYSDNGAKNSLKILSAPLDVAEKLAIGLYDHMETVVMTSATLTVAGDFSYIRNRLGLELDSRERVTEFVAVSPFDYNRQSAVVVPSFMPSPKDADFIRRTNEIILALASEVRRGMLVLFTSRGHLHRSYNELRDTFAQRGVTLLAQGVDGSRTVLLRRFREDVTSVLFGTDSFWEGVDVPGNALELVVIVRLPFAVPSEPIVQAQMEEIEKAGKNSFTDFSVPEAAIKLRQGAGRLIRRRDDRGAVVILDKRIATTWYGALFKRSLPGKMVRVENIEMLVESINRWFDDSNIFGKSGK